MSCLAERLHQTLIPIYQIQSFSFVKFDNLCDKYFKHSRRNHGGSLQYDRHDRLALSYDLLNLSGVWRRRYGPVA